MNRMTQIERILLLVIAAMLLFVAVASAHHSFAAVYDGKKTVTLDGKLVQFIFRNPHSFVHVEGKDEKGETIQYAIEWGGGGQLNQQGVTRETLKPGDHLVIIGNPGRNPEDHRLRMISLKRTSDGWTWGGRAGEKVE